MSDNPLGPDWWLASDGKWYPPTSRPGGGAPPVFDEGPADSPPAPDWWLASDGKWYPPSDHPSAAHRRATPIASVTPLLAGWLQGLLYATSALAVLALWFTASALTTFRDRQASALDWSEAHDLHLMAIGLFNLGFLATAILMIIWSFKASQAADRLQPHRRTWSPGWAIGGWFIPIASFIIPKLVLNEVERIATAPRSGARVVSDWRTQSTSPIGWLWWIAFVAASALFVVAIGVHGEDVTMLDPSEVRLGYTLWAFACLVFAAAGVLGAMFVRSLSRYLSPDSLEEWSDPHWG